MNRVPSRNICSFSHWLWLCTIARTNINWAQRASNIQLRLNNKYKLKTALLEAVHYFSLANTWTQREKCTRANYKKQILSTFVDVWIAIHLSHIWHRHPKWVYHSVERLFGHGITPERQFSTKLLSNNIQCSEISAKGWHYLQDCQSSGF